MQILNKLKNYRRRFTQTNYILSIWILHPPTYFTHPLIRKNEAVKLSMRNLARWIYNYNKERVCGQDLEEGCGPMKCTIKIKDIHTLVRNTTLWSGMKPALATKGIIVRYNKYDEVYISPKNKDGLISELLKVNGEIKITERI